MADRLMPAARKPTARKPKPPKPPTSRAANVKKSAEKRVGSNSRMKKELDNALLQTGGHRIKTKPTRGYYPDSTPHISEAQYYAREARAKKAGRK